MDAFELVLGSAYAVIVDFMPLLVAWFSVVFLGRQIWIYLLKDVIVEKLNEIQKAKSAIRQSASESLSDLEEFGFDYHQSKVGDELSSFGKEAFSLIGEKGYHSERGLATVSMVADRYFSIFHSKITSANSSDENFFQGFTGLDYSNLVFKSLDLIESYAARSVEMPKRVAVRERGQFPYEKSFLFSGSGVKYIKGLEQGPYIHPFGISCAEFFFRVVGVSVTQTNFIKNKIFFQVVRSNSILLKSMWDRKVYFPMEVDLGDTVFGRRQLSLMGFTKVKHLELEGDELSEHYNVFYSNLFENINFIKTVEENVFKKRFSEDSGYESSGFIIYPKKHCVMLRVKEDDANSAFLKKKKSVIDQIAQHSGICKYKLYLGEFFRRI